MHKKINQKLVTITTIKIIIEKTYIFELLKLDGSSRKAFSSSD